MENVNAETMVYKVTKSKAVCGMTIFSVALVVCVFAFAYAVSLIEPVDRLTRKHRRERHHRARIGRGAHRR